VYEGRVVNITKFGAFVSILPGRDGLVHISKMGGGKRIEKVEDVLELGQAISVKVDDVDPNGKVSLTPVEPLVPGGSSAGGSDAGSSDKGSSSEKRSSGRDSSDKGSSDKGSSDEDSSDKDSGPARESVSFEDSFDAEIREEFGDLGPGSERPSGGDGGRRGGGRRGGGRR
ncbi:MAG: S1 RNA-binding domain-containing protein, partial [Aquihabitans sp.]